MLDSHFETMPWKDEATNTSGAMRFVRTEMFTPEKGDRPGVPNVMIVLTGRPINLFSSD